MRVLFHGGADPLLGRPSAVETAVMFGRKEVFLSGRERLCRPGRKREVREERCNGVIWERSIVANDESGKLHIHMVVSSKGNRLCITCASPKDTCNEPKVSHSYISGCVRRCPRRHHLVV